MANRLAKIVRKPKGSKQKPIPVKIVSEATCAIDKPRGGVDKWEAQEALRTLQRAAEIRGNKTLMRAAKTEAGKQIKALSSVK